METQPLPNPFNAGAGVAPPVFAGRGAEESVLSVAVNQLGERDDDGKAKIAADVVVYGPRGHGKTVLLQRLRERAASHPGWGVLDVDVGTHGGSPAALAAFVAPQPLRRRAAKLLSGVKAQASFWGANLGIELPSMETSSWSLEAALTVALADGPRLLLCDEAHRLRPETCMALLDASQRLRGRGAPLLVVLAGTPVLQDVLAASGASFWERATIIPMGPLPEGAALQALIQPLQALGVHFDDPDALSSADEAMCRYPFFTQLLGEAVVGQLNESGARAFGAATALGALRRFTPARERFYDNRRTEVRRLGCVQAAAAAWGALKGHGPRASADLMEAAMEGWLPQGWTGAKGLSALRCLGVLWPIEGAVEPGIPSLLDGIKQAGGPLAAKAYAQGEAMGREWALAAEQLS